MSFVIALVIHAVFDALVKFVMKCSQCRHTHGVDTRSCMKCFQEPCNKDRIRLTQLFKYVVSRVRVRGRLDPVPPLTVSIQSVLNAWLAPLCLPAGFP